ncbi:MAG TPA: tetratricopeptide repeat protein [Thermoanaerobaculia bacterium]|nr:tetratricopeptide repeat protein [Thermoanaerobaculia bacterium]
MNKDNLLFIVAGLFLGFVAGYVTSEAITALKLQPPRRPPGMALPGDSPPSAEAGGGPAAAGPQAGGAPGGAGAPPMEEIRRLRDHVAANPDDADAVMRLANLNFDIQNWARARELYEQYLKLRPDQPDVLSDLGVTYRELGDPRGAISLFDRAQRLAPDHWQSRFNEVVVLAFDLQDYAGAEAVIAELRRLQPGNQDVERLAAEVGRRKAS